MPETILVTGGAGFVGRWVCEELLRRGNDVRVIDALVPQVHGQLQVPPSSLNGAVEFVHGDVRDHHAMGRALEGVDSVIHLAAEVGVGQSMYEVERFTSTNAVGTSVLLEQLIARPVRRIVTASSMCIYGEGLYRDRDGAFVEDADRRDIRDGQQRWDPVDAQGGPLTPLATPEWKRPRPPSIYALNKYSQECATHIIGAAHGIESVCLRLFNVYGSGQALINPYTGLLAICASRILAGERPVIFEDGKQRRDFVHVKDVARAFCDALTLPGVVGKSLNIGSGQGRSVAGVARALARAMGRPDIEPNVIGKARAGDIRHCFADMRDAREHLDFETQCDVDAGLAELAEWSQRQHSEDRVEQAQAELRIRGLVT